MLTGFLNTLATIISVTSLLIVTYGALIGVISFFRNELKRLTGNYSITNIRKLRAACIRYILTSRTRIFDSVRYLKNSIGTNT